MRNYIIKYNEDFIEWINERISKLDLENANHLIFTQLAGEIYEKGLSCLNLMDWLKTTDMFDDLEKSAAYMCFDKIKLEFRNEKLLLLYMFDFLFLRSKTDLKCILTI